MDDTPKVTALRLALSACFADSNLDTNQLLSEVPGRGELVQVALSLSDLVAELAGESWIKDQLAAELDEQP